MTTTRSTLAASIASALLLTGCVWNASSDTSSPALAVDERCDDEALQRAPAEPGDLAGLAIEAIDADERVAARARALLRAAGTAGVDALWTAHGEELRAALSTPSRALAPTTLRARAALDEACAQRDCDTSRLYWHTDLEAAKAEARETGKPILSLRLLGRLDDPLSCANSRFFRAVLYPDPMVNELLRERYVLHWRPERPAPRITIDFGDGDVLERTITGNSVHYVLDAEGRPLDAIPGLMSAEAFTKAISRGVAINMQLRALGGEPRERERVYHEQLTRYHARQLEGIGADLRAELIDAGYSPWQFRSIVDAAPSEPSAPQRPSPAKTDSPTADSLGPIAGAAMPRAIGKMRVERPMLRGLGELGAEAEPPDPEQMWTRLSERYAARVTLSETTLALMRRQEPTRRRDGASFEQMLAAFRASLAEDTVRNTWDLHRTIHRWMIADLEGPRANTSLEALNRRVYTELFLTPRQDPWLGMVPAATYTGLDDAGWRPSE